MFQAIVSNSKRASRPLFLCLSLSLTPTLGQTQNAQVQPPNAAPQDKDEVIRISAEIVQTDVMVFDKSGKFIGGLRPEEFELRVDGKPQQIDFFELIKAGSVDEDLQLRAARGGAGRSSTSQRTSSAPVATANALPLDRGRTIIFFVDDLHVTPSNIPLVRKTLKRFVEEEVGQNDEAAIMSASGQIGFLQQVTTEKVVLRNAIERVKSYARGRNFDNDRPNMTEAHAIAIDKGSPNVIEWFVQMTLTENPFLTPDTARQTVLQRARNMISFSNSIALQTLGSLEAITRRAAAMPGRKILFFVSEGFYIDRINSDTQRRLRRITDAAARAGVVIYSVDARGLTTGFSDASVSLPPDTRGLQTGVEFAQLGETQEPLRTLAEDTGGRALLNTNALASAVSKALSETSVYYLLAWRPESGDGRAEKFRQIQVSVRGRPDLQVLTRRGFYVKPPSESEPPVKNKKGASANAASAPANPKSPNADLLAALVGVAPRTTLPISLSLGYVRARADSMVLTVFVEFDKDSLIYEGEGETRKAVTDLVGAVYDERGKVLSTTSAQLAIPRLPGGQHPVQIYQYALPPGLHQVRFATRDKSGRVGSAWQWVEIPDPRKTGIFLSSLFIGERFIEGGTTVSDQKQSSPEFMVSTDRRFGRDSKLNFATFIYNAMHAQNAPPDVALQIQILRDNLPVVTTPLKKVQTEGMTDLTVIPYVAEISLAALPPGKYVLQMTAIDRTAKATATQRTAFVIE